MAKTLVWKHEGKAGPLFIEEDGRYSNYQDSDRQKPDGNGFYARWFTLSQARKIAKKEKLELEEC